MSELERWRETCGETWEERALRCAIEAHAYNPAQVLLYARDPEVPFADLDFWFEELRPYQPGLFMNHTIVDDTRT